MSKRGFAPLIRRQKTAKQKSPEKQTENNHQLLLRKTIMSEKNNAEKISSMAKELWETVLTDEKMVDLVRRNKLSVYTEFRDPEFHLWISPDEVMTGDAAKKESVINLKMSWETGSALYADEIGLTTAISSGAMKVKGPLLKLMKLVPLLQRAHIIWPDVCKKSA